MVTLLTSTGTPRPADYRTKKTLAQLRYYYVINPESPFGDWARRAVVEPAFQALHREYGITVRPLDFGQQPAPLPDGITYLLYGPTDPLALSAAERTWLAALSGRGVKTNVIAAYPLAPGGVDRPEYARARVEVPALCDELDINVLYADDVNTAVGIRTNTWPDIYINAIGETIRVKYRPRESLDPQDNAVRERLGHAHAADIAELARLHREHHLWQRRPYTDGSVMFTHDGFWYTSQTVTDKTLMTPADFDLITSYDEGSRAITYTGPRLPSSDAPEFLMLSTLLSMHARRPRLIVHFHHRELTRGPRHRELVSDSTIEGGLFSAGRRYFEELRGKSSDWFIVREHGMVWVGDTVAEFAAYVRRVVC